MGNYHGKTHTNLRDGSIVKRLSRGENYGLGPGVPHHRLFGGRKTRKHKRKTKKRKHHRRKHKRKTRRR